MGIEVVIKELHLDTSASTDAVARALIDAVVSALIDAVASALTDADEEADADDGHEEKDDEKHGEGVLDEKVDGKIFGIDGRMVEWFSECA
jgi:hypothetical protein